MRSSMNCSDDQTGTPERPELSTISIGPFDYRLVYRSKALYLPILNPFRWISFQMQTLGALFLAGIAAYLVYVPNHGDEQASYTGFSLNMAGMTSSSRIRSGTQAD